MTYLNSIVDLLKPPYRRPVEQQHFNTHSAILYTHICLERWEGNFLKSPDHFYAQPTCSKQSQHARSNQNASFFEQMPSPISHGIEKQPYKSLKLKGRLSRHNHKNLERSRQIRLPIWLISKR